MRQVIIAHSRSNLSNTSISKLVSIPRTTVSTIVNDYNRTGKTNAFQRGGDHRSKLSETHKNFINSLIDEDPTITLKRIVGRVKENFNLEVGQSTIHRCIADFHYTLKNLVIVPEVRNCDRTLVKRYDYANQFNRKILEVEDKNLIFIDEVGFSVVSRTKRGRSLKGTSPFSSVVSVRSRNISVIGAMNKYGMINFHINDRPVNGEDFKRFVIGLKNLSKEKEIEKPIFVMDNARIHHYKGLLQTIESENLEVLYLPPYSPFLNPIENAFSKWKNYVIRAGSRNESELKIQIETGFLTISQTDCDGYYRKMLRYVSRCLDNENIME